MGDEACHKSRRRGGCHNPSRRLAASFTTATNHIHPCRPSVLWILHIFPKEVKGMLMCTGTQERAECVRATQSDETAESTSKSALACESQHKQKSASEPADTSACLLRCAGDRKRSDGCTVGQKMDPDQSSHHAGAWLDEEGAGEPLHARTCAASSNHPHARLQRFTAPPQTEISLPNTHSQLNVVAAPPRARCRRLRSSRMPAMRLMRLPWAIRYSCACAASPDATCTQRTPPQRTQLPSR